MTNPSMAPNDQIAKKNVVVLIAIQSLAGSMIPAHFLLGGLIGNLIAPSKILATLPISATIIGGVIAAPIITRLMNNFGRVPAFIFGTVVAILGLILAGFSANMGNFLLFTLGALMIGFYMSTQGFFRFASAEMATPEFRSRAISFSILGGIFSAIIGPTLASRFSVPNIALPYFIMAVISLLTIGLYFFLTLPHNVRPKNAAQLSAWTALKNRKILAALVISITSYAIMNLIMTSTPLAVEGCGYTRADSGSIVRAHVLAMFIPSFFTGYFIRWFGLKPVVFTGIFILALSSIIALMGIDIQNFYLALILLGIGWNFGFIGGTNMLTNAVDDPQLARSLQGLNDTILWFCVALASLSSGLLMNGFADNAQDGWHLVNLASLPILTIALLIGGYLSRD